MNPFDEGYHAGLMNDRANPHSFWSPMWAPWAMGNRFGVVTHCAIVEAVYLKNMEDAEHVV